MQSYILLFSLCLLCRPGISYLYYEEPEVLDSGCPGKPNLLNPWTGEPTLVKQVANGSLYTAGSGDDELFGK